MVNHMWYRRYEHLKYQLRRLHVIEICGDQISQVIFLGCSEHVAEGAALRGGADDVFHFV
jgi:hypothetical protein